MRTLDLQSIKLPTECAGGTVFCFSKNFVGLTTVEVSGKPFNSWKVPTSQTLGAFSETYASDETSTVCFRVLDNNGVVRFSYTLNPETSGGSGAIIDDNSIATDRVWSSNKTNTEVGNKWTPTSVTSTPATLAGIIGREVTVPPDNVKPGDLVYDTEGKVGQVYDRMSGSYMTRFAKTIAIHPDLSKALHLISPNKLIDTLGATQIISKEILTGLNHQNLNSLVYDDYGNLGVIYELSTPAYYANVRTIIIDTDTNILKPTGVVFGDSTQLNPKEGDYYQNSYRPGKPDNTFTSNVYQYTNGNWVQVPTGWQPDEWDLWTNLNDTPNTLWYWLSGDWQPLNFTMDLSDYVTKTELAAHTDNTSVHTSTNEKTVWNGKVGAFSVEAPDGNYIKSLQVTSAGSTATFEPLPTGGGGNSSLRMQLNGVNLDPEYTPAGGNKVIDIPIDPFDLTGGGDLINRAVKIAISDNNSTKPAWADYVAIARTIQGVAFYIADWTWIHDAQLVLIGNGNGTQNARNFVINNMPNDVYRLLYFMPVVGANGFLNPVPVYFSKNIDSTVANSGKTGEVGDNRGFWVAAANGKLLYDNPVDLATY